MRSTLMDRKPPARHASTIPSVCSTLWMRFTACWTLGSKSCTPRLAPRLTLTSSALVVINGRQMKRANIRQLAAYVARPRMDTDPLISPLQQLHRASCGYLRATVQHEARSILYGQRAVRPRQTSTFKPRGFQPLGAKRIRAAYVISAGNACREMTVQMGCSPIGHLPASAPASFAPKPLLGGEPAPQSSWQYERVPRTRLLAPDR